MLISPDRTMNLVEAAVRDATYGRALLGGLNLDGGLRDRARELVVKSERAGEPPGDLLRRLLGEMLRDLTERRHEVVFNAAIERLERSSEPIPGAPDLWTTDAQDTVVRPDGPLVMVSFSHGDFDDVRALVEALRARGVNVTWDQDQRPGSHIPTWVVSTYQRADWIVLACSPSYGASVQRQMRDPVTAPSVGKGVAQEVRMLCTEDLHYGSARFVPAMLPNAQPGHIPLVARGQLRYVVPDEYDALAEAVKRPGPRAG